MLGQNIGSRFLVPLAVNFLADNPLEGGTMSDGALMRSLLRLPREFWQTHPDLWWDAREVVFDLQQWRATIEELDPLMRAFQESPPSS